MSRRRYISTDISTDIKLADLAEYGSTPLLLYTWAIPHMDDWGRITGEPRQFKLMVCPALDITVREVDEALNQIANAGLWIRYEVDGKRCISIHEDQWFKHQSYINKAKRSDDSGSNYPSPISSEEHRKTPQNAKEYQETSSFTEDEQELPQNAVSFSFSPSFSSSPSYSNSSDEDKIGPKGPTRTKLIAPTIEEVIAYCEERQNSVDPVKWHDHYTSNGWKVGKNPMKDWKAAVRTWERTNTSSSTSTAGRNGQAARQQSSFDRIQELYRIELEKEEAERAKN